MENAAQIEVKHEPKLCPQCNRTPRIITGLMGGYYVMCEGHCETKVAKTAEEAIRLWNNNEYED